MKIIIDAMGGDNAPLEIIKGTAAASLENDANYILVGNSKVIEQYAEQFSFDKNRYEIVHTDDFISMEDDPMCVIKEKRNSSLATGLKMLADGTGDAFVSAGNTGALFAGATLIVKKISGINRAAIGAILPFSPPVLLLDSGANLVVTDDIIEQFALMGSTYMKKMFALESPRVGLLNNGEEACKGTELQIKSYAKLSENSNINFAGNIESNRLPENCCDVLVCDGFCGNILLKSIEGIGKLIIQKFSQIFKSKDSTDSEANSPMKMQLYGIMKTFDSTEHGGAPILGISKPVVKAHGSSNAKAFKNAIKQAVNYSQTNVINDILTEINRVNSQKQI